MRSVAATGPVGAVFRDARMIFHRCLERPEPELELELERELSRIKSVLTLGLMAVAVLGTAALFALVAQ